MPKSFFFYDLETSGLNPRTDRVMQFAGQRTTLDLEPVGEPVNILVQLADDILPSPYAIMVTGITPQKTREEGITEAEFARFVSEEVFTPDTIAVGFNNIRFDDEFVRNTLWRNFYDPYEWCWKNGCSRWDLLDVVRMTRALRPEGINWPVDKHGAGTNRLELLTAENNLEHMQAHDALSDVRALIAVTRLIRAKQPKLYEYLFAMRDKKAVMQLVDPTKPQLFVYSSGRYDSQFHKTTVAVPIGHGSKPGSVLVYDLRLNPALFVGMSVEDMRRRLYAKREERQQPDFVPLPIKELAYNRCPAVAPLGVLEHEDAWARIQMTPELVQEHRAALFKNPELIHDLSQVLGGKKFPKSQDVEDQLYDNFTPDSDKVKIEAVRNATAQDIAKFNPHFADDRLTKLLLHYKARNFPQILSEEERTSWEAYKSQKIQARIPAFMADLQRIAATTTDDQQQFLLQELQLWAESVVSLE
ncbi:MAG TPA: exodeoxyribonuclease I [Candidatus Saccharimonadales bacterium]